MKYLFLTLLASASLPLAAQSDVYSSSCKGKSCIELAELKGAAEGLYAVGTDNNTISSAFISSKTLKNLSKTALASPLEAAFDANLAELNHAAFKECVFFAKGAYGTHLSKYSVENLSEPFYGKQEIDFQNMVAQAFASKFRTLQNSETKLKVWRIDTIPSDQAQFPAQDELFAAPCALALEAQEVASDGKLYTRNTLILRGGVTD